MTLPKILFVDDEANVLKGLQRSLHGMRAEWEMVFLESGEKGLEVLESEGFDVIVSDMRMPGMNGAQFLNEAKAHRPGSARIILSGHADRDLILQCVGAAHQYLTKPCEVETLKEAIQRAFQARPGAELEKARTLLAGGEDLPVLETRYRALQRLLDDPEASMSGVAGLVERDIGMTAKLLKLTNSAFFGLRRSVSSVREALQVLGVDTVKALLLMEGFLNQVRLGLPRGIDLSQVEEGSFAVAGMARKVAQSEAPALSDGAFTAGLLHLSGLLVAARAQPQAYSDILLRMEHESRSLDELELEVLGVDHAQVGAYLLGLWGLPIAVVEGVRSHLRPSQGPPTFHTGTAVHGACLVQSANASPLWRIHRDEIHLDSLAWKVQPRDWNEAFQKEVAHP